MERILASLVFMVLLLPGFVLGETMNDLFYRDGLYFNRSTNVPFTGNLTGGNFQGTIRNGKREGPWFSYYDDGQLEEKGTYKDGKEESP